MTATALPAPAHAQGIQTSNKAGSDGFEVVQIATTDPDKLVSDWSKPAAEVALATETRARRNQVIATFVVFHGCRADAAGNCNVTADFEVVGPYGNLYNRSEGVEVWVGHPAPPGGDLQLSAGALGLRVEDKDPLGPYRVRVATTDHVAAITVQTEQVLTASAD